MTSSAALPPTKNPEGRRRTDEPPPVRRARVAPAVVAVSFALLLAGWGGVAGAANGPASPITSGRDHLTSSTSFETCLKAHGVSLPKNLKFPKNFKPSKNFKPPKGFKPGTGSKRPTGTGFKPPKNFKPSKESKKFQAAFKACGGHANFFGGTPPKGAAAASAVRAYLGCLSDHGVKVPSKDRNSRTLPNLSSDPKFAAANKVCSVLLPAGPTSPMTTTTTATGA